MAITRYAGDRFTTAAGETKPTGVLDGAYLIDTGNLTQFVRRTVGGTSQWTSIAGGGGGGSASGDNTQVQFNNTGSFAGNANLTFTDGNRLNVNKLGISGNVYDSNDSAGEGGMILTNEGATGVNWKNIESVLSGVGGSGVANYGARWSDEDTLTSGIIFDKSTLNSGVLKGSVGIGTSTPYAELEVHKNSAGTAKLLISSVDALDWGAEIEFHGSTGWNITAPKYNQNSNSGYDLGINYNRASFAGDFYIANNGNKKLTINKDGNVGIGVNNSQYNFEVNGTAKLRSTLYVAGLTTIGAGSKAAMIIVGDSVDTTITLGSTSLTGEQFIIFRNSSTSTQAWKCGMGTDQNFRIDYGTPGSISSYYKLKIDQSGNILTTGNVGVNSGTVTAYAFVGMGSGLTYLNASALSGGTVPLGVIGTNTPSSSTYLRGDNSWQPISSGNVTGTGTANYVSKWTGTNSQGNSKIIDNDTSFGFDTTPSIGWDSYNSAIQLGYEAVIAGADVTPTNGGIKVGVAFYADRWADYFLNTSSYPVQYEQLGGFGSHQFKVSSILGSVGDTVSITNTKTYTITIAGSSASGNNFTIFGATSNNVGTTFTATSTGTISGSGRAKENIVWNTAMTVARDGKVGIGITNPSVKFQVLGSALVEGHALTINGTSDSSQKFDDLYLVNSAQGIRFDYTVIADTKLQLRTSNAARLTIDSTGNVGIGTDAPQAALDIAAFGASVDTEAIINGIANYEKVLSFRHFDKSQASGLYNNAGYVGCIVKGNPDAGGYEGVLSLGHRNSSSVALSVMHLTETGKVGILIPSPPNTLSVSPIQYRDISKTAYQSGTTVTGVSTAFTAAMVGSEFVYDDGTSAGAITAYTSATVITVTTSLSISQGNARKFGIYYQGLQVNSTGCVGIGTNTASFNLDVVGTTKLLGAVTIAGAVGVSDIITANSFVGVGSQLTTLNATKITTGTVDIARLGSTGTRDATTYLNGANAWVTATTGTVSGSGTVGALSKWVGGSALGNSLVTETASLVTVGGALSATTITSSANAGFVGVGSQLTKLKADKLLTGTVAVARLGSTGTRDATTYLNGANAWVNQSTLPVSTATQTALDLKFDKTGGPVTGVVTAPGFVGAGNSITALDAGQITAGTVGIARLASGGSPSSSTFLRGDGLWAGVPSGTVTGGGTTNKVPLWSSSTGLGDSKITQTLVGITVAGAGRFDNSASTPVLLHINDLNSNDFASIDVKTGSSAAKTLVLNPSGGNVGIGTGYPGSFKLAVAGPTNIMGALTIGAYTLPNSDGSSGYHLQTDGAGTVTWEAAGGGGTVTGTGTANYISKWTGTSSQGNSQIFDNGSVGISTAANLNSKLNVYGATGANLTSLITCMSSDATTNGGAGIFLKASSNTTLNRFGVQIAALRNSNNNGSADFVFSLEKTDASGLAERVRFLGDGKVGIGTNAPTARLTIDSDTVGESLSGGLRLQNSNGANNDISPIYFGVHGGTRRAKCGIGWKRTGSYGIGKLLFALDNNTDDADVSFANDTKVTFQGDGNVGIGTDTPSVPLEVVGADSGITISSASASRPHLRLVNGTTNMLQLSANGAYGAIGDGTDANRYMSFKGGDVGIGTNSPNSTTNKKTLEINATWGGVIENSVSGTVKSRWDWSTGGITQFGTYVNEPLHLITNSAMAVTILANGKVGIGTASPNAKLEVYSDGSIAQGAEIRLQHANNNTTDVVSTVNFANSIGSVAMIQAGTTGANNSGYISLFTDNAGTSAERMRIISDGKVLIGDSTALGPFGEWNWTPLLQQLGTQGIVTVRCGADVYGGAMHLASARGSNASPTIVVDGDRAGGVYYHAYDGVNFSNTPAAIECFIDGAPAADDTPGRLVFSTAPDGSNSITERMRITSAGSVGIGTDAPSELLEVKGSGANIRISSDANTYLSLDSTQTNGDEWQIFNAVSGTTSGLQFKDVDTSKLVMLLQEDGNVGIGTASSTYNLKVQGTAKITGTLSVGGVFTTDGNTTLGTIAGNSQTIHGTLDLDDSKLTLGGSGGTNGYTIVTDGSGNISWSSAGTGTVSGTGTANYISKWTGTSSQGNSTISDNGSIVTVANDFHIYKVGADKQLWLSEGTSGSGATNVQLNPNGVSYLRGGSVGIGTNAPAGLLSLANETRTLDVKLKTSPATGDMGVQFRAGSGDYLGLAAGGGTGIGIVIDNTNKVGIGTAAPGATLDVHGSTVRISSTGGSYRRLMFFDSLASPSKNNFQVAVQEINNALHIGPSTAVGGTTFSGSTGLAMLADGKVGIGTAAPDQKLSVSGNIQARSGGWFIARSADNAGYSYLKNPSTSGSEIAFHTSGEKMRILSNGKVGIGTATPSSLLELYSSAPELTIKDGGTWGTNATAYINLKDSSSSMAYIGVTETGGDLDIKQIKAGAVRIFTNNTEKVRVLSDGNVGIGTTSPTSKLQIIGDASTSGLSVKSGGNGGTYPFRVTWSGGTEGDVFCIDDNLRVGIGTNAPSAPLQIYGSNNQLLKVTSTDAYAEICISDNTTTSTTSSAIGVHGNRLYLYTGGGQRLSVLGDGKVGIGTTAPAQKLHVLGDAIKFERTDNAVALQLYNNNASPADGASLGYLQFMGKDNDGTANMVYSEVRGGVHSNTNSAVSGFLSFLTTNNGTSVTEKMRIQPDGKVGIGVTAPVAKLHIDDSATGDNKGLYIQNTHNTDGDSAAIRFGFAGNDNANKGGIFFKRTANYGRGSLIFATENTQTNDNVDASDAKLTILADGNVGIGTVSPDAKLHVNGTTRATQFYTSYDWTTRSGGINIGNQGLTTGAVSFYDGVLATSASIYRDSSSVFFVGARGGVQADGIAIATDGKVGIGTTAPSAKLEVAGDTTITKSSGATKLRLFSGNDDPYISFGDNNTNWAVGVDRSDSGAFKISNTSGVPGTSDKIVIKGASGQIQFNSYGSGTHTGTSAYKLSVDSSGNIIETSIGSGAVDGSGTTNYVSKWTDGDTIGNSVIRDDGTNVGIGTTGNGYKLRVQGNVYISGTLTEASSIAIKENIETYSPSLDIINKIRPVRYNKKKSKKKEIGLVAEELAEMFPELVETDEKGNAVGVNYSRAVAVLLHGFKELYKEVKELKEKI